MSQPTESRAQFTAMTEGTAEDWKIISDHYREFSKDLPNRVIEHLKLLDGDFGGFPVDRLQHSLQAATLAHRDGKDEEYVVMALLHDIGDTLGPYNHADIAATMLQPFLSEKNHWIVKHHGIFQGYYFFHHIGLDRNQRDQFESSPHYKDCAEFCEKYDQNAFDPAFKAESLEFFEPMIQNVMARPKRSLYKATE